MIPKLTKVWKPSRLPVPFIIDEILEADTYYFNEKLSHIFKGSDTFSHTHLSIRFNGSLGDQRHGSSEERLFDPW